MAGRGRWSGADQNNLTVFKFLHGGGETAIRVVLLNGVTWFVAMDVCGALGLNPAQVTNHLRPLGADEKRTVTRRITPTLFRGGRGTSQIALISESGLYKFVMRSDKPQARPFQDWVTRDVLPAIRKDGAYVMGEEKLKDPQSV